MSSIAEKEVPNQERMPKKTKTERRHGACEPCKQSKTRCDGLTPCTACRSEKRKSRTCVYSPKSKSIQASRADSERRKVLRDGSVGSDGSEPQDVPPYQIQGHLLSTPRTLHLDAPSLMHRQISLCGLVEEFIRVKPIKSKASQNIKQLGGYWMELKKLLDSDDLGKHVSTPTIKQRSTQDRLAMSDLWNIQLDNIVQQVNAADLKGAWEAIPSLLRSIEVWETWTNSKELSFPPTSELSEKIASTCQRLVELDWNLGFFLGGSSPYPWDRSKFLLPKIEESKLRDDTLTSKVEVFSTIQEMLEIDTSTENGVWKFLQFLSDIKKAQPARTLERMATCITAEDPAEKQLLKLMANLAFTVMYCRTACVGSYYSRDDGVIPAPDGSASSIVQELKLHTSRQITDQCGQVNKHARNALEAFQRLCDIDAKATAKCWFRLQGGLTAAVLLGVHSMREKKSETKKTACIDVRVALDQVEEQFLDLQRIDPTCPIFDIAIKILRNLVMSHVSSVKTAKNRQQITRSRSGSISDDGRIEPSTESVRVAADASIPRQFRKRSLDGTVQADLASEPKRIRLSANARQQSPMFNIMTGQHQPCEIESSAYPRGNPHPFDVQETFDGDHEDASPCMSFPSSSTSSFADLAPQDIGLHAQQAQHVLQSPYQVPPEDLHPPSIINGFDDEYIRQYHNAQLNVSLQSNIPAYGVMQNGMHQNQGFQPSPSPIHNGPIMHALPGFPTIQSSGSMAHNTPATESNGATFFYSTPNNFETSKAQDARGMILAMQPPSGFETEIRHGPSAHLTALGTSRVPAWHVSHTTDPSFHPPMVQPPLMRRASEPTWQQGQYSQIAPGRPQYDVNQHQLQGEISYYFTPPNLDMNPQDQLGHLQQGQPHYHHPYQGVTTSF